MGTEGRRAGLRRLLRVRVRVRVRVGVGVGVGVRGGNAQPPPRRGLAQAEQALLEAEAVILEPFEQIFRGMRKQPSDLEAGAGA